MISYYNSNMQELADVYDGGKQVAPKHKVNSGMAIVESRAEEVADFNLHRYAARQVYTRHIQI